MNLKRATATSAAFGPFMNSTGVTLLSTKTTIDGRIYKKGSPGAFTPDSWAIDTRGMYVVGISAAHDDTVGHLRIYFATTGTGAYAWLPVWRDFTVMGGQAYDSVISTADRLQVHVMEGTAGYSLIGGSTAGVTLAGGQTSGYSLIGGSTSGITLAAGQTSGYTLAAGSVTSATLATAAVNASVFGVGTAGYSLISGSTAGITLAAGQTSGYSLIGGAAPTSGITLAGGQTSGYTLAAGSVTLADGSITSATLATNAVNAIAFGVGTAGYNLIGGLVFTTSEIATSVWKWLDAPRTITGTAGFTLAEGAVSTAGYNLINNAITSSVMADSALAKLFHRDLGLYAASVSGSVVKEIADNAGGSALTTADIADATVRQMFSASAGAYSGAQAYSVVKQTADNAGGSALTTAAISVGVWQWAGAAGRTVTTSGITLAAGQTSGYTLAAGEVTTSGITLAGGQTAGVTLVGGQTSGYTLAAGQIATSGITLASGQTSGYSLVGGAAPTSGVTLAGGQTSGYSLVGGVLFTTAQTADAVIRQMVSASAGAYASAHAYSVVKQTADNAGGSALTTGVIADAVWDHTTRALVTTSGFTLVEGAVGTTTQNAQAAWAYGTRTLTQTAAAVGAAVAGSDLTITRYVDFSAAITSLGDITNRSRLWWTVKERGMDADSDAIVMVELTSGALILNRVAVTSASYGSITVTSSVHGDVTLALKAAGAGVLEAAGEHEYDIKVLRTTGAVDKLTSARARIIDTPTRAVS